MTEIDIYTSGELANAQRAIASTPLELGILLDRSSSMRSLQSATLQAFNSLLAEQKHLNPDATRLTLMLFNHKSETVVDNHPLAGIPDMSAAAYQPEGGTALWDGIGDMLERAGKLENAFDLNRDPERQRGHPDG